MVARYDWESIRAEYEAGATQAGLAREYGVSQADVRALVDNMLKRARHREKKFR